MTAAGARDGAGSKYRTGRGAGAVQRMRKYAQKRFQYA